ncbi:Orange carotenoid protein [Waterburya agarophytonicola K14]|uniref:Orange carotenoid protein n=1 Tax=Waterburya agarophytonicola KI4 TaxID=2874699 RepID=A0A964FE45_9CYAN|nr:orange carotenoid protein N-terminal domain-containing protein [Waterburya agarophytonicola]MCC0176290.1 Orange carotenoid protein [Waterburya agarophytonicola KI4]
MGATASDSNVSVILNSYSSLSTDEKLALLWYVYTKMGTSVTPAAPGAAADEIAGGLFNQVKELSFEKQIEVQRSIIEGKDTIISREYGSLSENTKLYFWYRLAQGMEAGTIIPVPDDYEPTGNVTQLLSQIESMEFEQQITLLRDAVVNAGAEPKTGAGV